MISWAHKAAILLVTPSKGHCPLVLHFQAGWWITGHKPQYSLSKCRTGWGPITKIHKEQLAHVEWRQRPSPKFHKALHF
jgi:hypothetical protein